MKNFVQKGEAIILVAGGDITVGVPQFIGGMAVIPQTSGVSGDSIACDTKGVFSLTKKASLEVSQGDDLYWDSNPGEITKTAADGVPIGKAFEDAADSDTTVLVNINASRPFAQAATVAAVDDADADGTYGAEEAALINEIKARLNSTISALKAAGLMASA